VPRCLAACGPPQGLEGSGQSCPAMASESQRHSPIVQSPRCLASAYTIEQQSEQVTLQINEPARAARSSTEALTPLVW